MATWQFVAGRHVDSHPIAIARWDRELDTWKEDNKWLELSLKSISH